MSDIAIDVQGLKKDFNGKTVVNGVDLSIPRGQVWGFLGPNGSGKTTTIRMICGLLTPTAGHGQCLGFDIQSESAEIKRRTGYMTQRFSFWEDLSIRENLTFVARMYGLKERQKLVDTTLDELDLSHRQHQLAGALSGGWKQRLALAAVTMHSPKLLLLDEPTAGVDPQARRDFWDKIHALTAQGLTILVSTHYMDEAERCDQIVYLAHGELITHGTVKSVIQEASLVTFRATGKNVRTYAADLKQASGVQTAAYFGAALHVSGKDKASLQQTLSSSPYNQLDWEEIQPGLEEVFISLMKDAGVDRRSA